MSSLIEEAAEHWCYIAPLLRKPATEAEYDALVESIDELLVLIGEDEFHPLAGLLVQMGDLVAAYDREHRPMPPVTRADALRFL
ncbi:hypothetical protein [Pseudomonas sp. R5(2019)]|uniref:hypothetical protein n=1 Tax=Pseudomonas sp. R5(2019) TaxID=2697566 RepID=UPI001412C319|nr:hypothetical protein [Pseudomonas sp. R5(2019)]NBA93992.1 hypothetical protein [Pseudomonas sp. R5(2019)]